MKDGSDVHNIDNYNNTILKTSEKQSKTCRRRNKNLPSKNILSKIRRERICSLLNKFPEIRPFF